jgi:hypothetical protein
MAVHLDLKLDCKSAGCWGLLKVEHLVILKAGSLADHWDLNWDVHLVRLKAVSWA